MVVTKIKISPSTFWRFIFEKFLLLTMRYSFMDIKKVQTLLHCYSNAQCQTASCLTRHWFVNKNHCINSCAAIFTLFIVFHWWCKWCLSHVTVIPLCLNGVWQLYSPSLRMWFYYLECIVLLKTTFINSLFILSFILHIYFYSCIFYSQTLHLFFYH